MMKFVNFIKEYRKLIIVLLIPTIIYFGYSPVTNLFDYMKVNQVKSCVGWLEDFHAKNPVHCPDSEEMKLGGKCNQMSSWVSSYTCRAEEQDPNDYFDLTYDLNKKRAYALGELMSSGCLDVCIDFGLPHQTYHVNSYIMNPGYFNY